MLMQTEATIDQLISVANMTPAHKPKCEEEVVKGKTQLKRPTPYLYSPGSEMPYFVKTFSHSMEEIEYLKGMEE